MITSYKSFWKLAVLILSFVAGNGAILYTLNQSDGVEWAAEQLVRSNKHFQTEITYPPTQE